MDAKLKSIIDRADSFGSDSRLLSGKAIFVALKGLKADGHDFVPSLLEEGLMGAVVSRQWAAEATSLREHLRSRLFVVEDTQLAHREIAAAFRRKWSIPVIAVGGSAGKSSTKDFLYSLLSEEFSGIKTQQSQNGELGIPKTLEQLREGMDFAVIEVGIDDKGDMARHMELLSPDWGLLTSIGAEHLNKLVDLKGVFAEERLLVDAILKKGARGYAYVPESDPYLARLGEHERIKKVGERPEALGEEFSSPQLLGKHMQSNAALALALALDFGLSQKVARRGLLSLEPPEGRGRLIELPGRTQARIIADHYNSNPDSLRAALGLIAEVASGLDSAQKHLILGDMLDLGEASEEAHRELSEAILAVRPALLHLVGPQMKVLFDSLEKKQQDGSASFELRHFSKTEDCARHWSKKRFEGVLLLKASRGMAFEKILSTLLD